MKKSLLLFAGIFCAILSTSFGTDTQATDLESGQILSKNSRAPASKAGSSERKQTTPVYASKDCEPYGLPFVENFDASWDFPECWSMTGDDFDFWISDCNSYSGQNSLRLGHWTGGYAILISPQISADISETVVNFKTILGGCYSYGKLFVGTMSDPADESTFSSFVAFDVTNRLYTGQPWHDFTVFFGDYSGSDQYIAFMLGYEDVEYNSVMFIDDISFDYIPDCPAPYNLSASNITASSADLMWIQYGEADSWNIEWGEAGFEPGNGTLITGITSIPYLLDGLSDNTAYHYYVQANCGDEELSTWTGPHGFVTQCIPFEVPFTEGFDESTDFPGCWSYLVVSDGGHEAWTDVWISEWLYYSPPHSLNIYESSSFLILVSPPIEAPLNTIRLRFWGMTEWDENDIVIGTINCPDDPGSFTEIATLSLQESWQNYVVYFDGFLGDDQYVGFKFGSGIEYTSSSYAIDDITFEYLPSCPEPHKLSAENISHLSTDLGWQQVGEAESWNVEWGPAGFEPGTGTLIENLQNNAYSLTGLDEQSQYTFYVQAVCSENELSEWSLPYHFTTKCAPFLSPIFENFDSSLDLPACWNIAATNSNHDTEVRGGVAYSSPNSLRFSAWDSTIQVLLTSPPVSVSLDNVTVSFYARTFWTNGSLQVGTVDDPNDVLTFNEIHSITITPSWQFYEFHFEGYSGDHKYIGFLRTGGAHNPLFLDDILIDFTPLCPIPNQLTTQNVTSTGAILQWSQTGEADYWNIEYGPEGFEQGSGTLIEGVSESYHAISNLEPFTTYAFIVQANCGVQGFSEWSAPYLFTTPCIAAEIPFFEGFESGYVHNTPVAECWTQESVAGNDQWMVNSTFTTSNRTPRTGNFNATLFRNNTNWLFHPVELTAGIIYDFELYARQTGSNPQNASIRVAFGPEDNAASMTNTIIEQTGLIAGGYQHLSHMFIPDESGTFYIGILGTNTEGGFSFISMDDIHLKEGPLCAYPTNITISNIDTSEAELNWEQVGSAESWVIEYNMAGFEPGTGTTVVGINEKPYTLTELEPGTFYDFYVQADCGASGLSEWSGPHTFMTECVTAEVPFFEGFEIGYIHDTPVEKCWTQESVSGTSQWMINSIFTTNNRTPRTGNFNATLFQGNTNWLFYPVELTAGTIYDFEMYARQSGTNPQNANIRVAYGPEDNAASMTNTIIEQTGLIAGGYQHISHMFIPDESGTFYIGILGTINLWQGYISMDDIHLKEYLACPEPINIAFQNITTTGAELNWEQVGTTHGWNLEWGLAGFEQGQGVLEELVQTNSFLFEELVIGTHYDVYIQTVCIDNEESNWVGPLNFKTLAEGDNCTNPIDLAGWHLPYYSGTTTTAGNNFSFCSMDNSKDLIFYYDVDPGATIRLWQTFNNFSGRHTLRWGGNCPGQQEVGCNWHNHQLEWTNTTGSIQRVWYITGGGSWSGSEGEFTLVWELISCSRPTELSAGNITTNSAELSWFDAGNGLSWEIEYGHHGFTQGNGTLVEGVTDNPFTVMGLDHSARYQFYVRSVCGDDEVSEWSDPFTFDTLCQTYGLPFAESFDSNQFPVCWSQSHTGEVASNRWSISNSSNAGGSRYELRASSTSQATTGTARLITPAVDLSNTENPVLYFKHRYLDNASGLSFKIQSSTDGISWSDEAFSFESGNGNIGPETVIMPVSQSGDNVYLSWLIEGDFSKFNAYFLDDVSVYDLTDCPEPYNVLISDITNSSAQVSWMQPGEAAHYTIEWGYAGFEQGEGTTVSNISNTSQNIGGLVGNTAYSFYLRAHCDEGLTSEWTGPHSFTTECDIFAIPFSESFDLWKFPDCWSQSFSGQITSNRWAISNSALAGGTPFEMRATKQSGTGTSRLIVAPVDLSSASNPILEFNHYIIGLSEGCTFKVQTSTNGENWIDEAFSFTSGEETIGPEFISMPLITKSATTYIAFTIYGNHLSFENWHIDDIFIDEETCPRPFRIEASNISPSSADLDWEQLGEVNSWNVQWGIEGFWLGSGTIVENINTPAFSLSGLVHSTDYDLYVQANCANGESSTWSGPHRFQTGKGTEVTISASPEAICVGGHTQLEAIAAYGYGNYSYSWTSDPPGFTSDSPNPMFSPTENTVFHVFVSDNEFTISESILITVYHDPPQPVSNLLPINGRVVPHTMVTFSWQPGTLATSYDLYLWPESDPMPQNPVAENITAIQHTIDGLSYATTYNWKVVAKNPCQEAESVIQYFVVTELPDLIVTNINVPTDPYSSQQIEVSWTVFNQGNASTLNHSWHDAVYLSLNSIPMPDQDIYLGAIGNPQTLPANTGYTNSLNVTLPDYTIGDYYIHIKTDRFNKVPEMDKENNLGVEPINISLTPPPDLQVTQIIIPSIAFSGNHITVEWTTTNAGPGIISGKTWRDRIYLSPEPDFNPQGATVLGQRSFSHQLLPEESYTANHQVQIPNYISGDYYIYVYTDVNNTVYEHANENNNVLRSNLLEIVLSPPADLLVTNIINPFSISNNEVFTISWSVVNDGAIKTQSGGWTDVLYLSTDAIFDPESAIELGSLFYFAGIFYPSCPPGEPCPPIDYALTPGTGYTRSLSITAPSDIFGEFFLFVHTDAYNNEFEFDVQNNLVMATNPITINYSDLSISEPLLADTANSGQNLLSGWKITNMGPGKVTNITITDKVFLSQEIDVPIVDAIEIGSLSYNNTILPGQTFHKNLQLTIPDGISGKYYVFFETNADQNLFENGLVDNNIAIDSIYIQLSPYPDLMITDNFMPGNIVLGLPHELEFAVKNAGDANIIGKQWEDAIYISNSPVFSNENAVKLWQKSINQPLSVNNQYANNATLSVPLYDFAGYNQLFLHFLTDANNDVFELNTQNNLVSSNAIPVIIPPKIDLLVSSALANADTTSSEQQIQFSYTVLNNSTSTEVWGVSQWQDAIYLSDDLVWDSNDILVSAWDVDRTVQTFGTYSESREFAVPSGFDGDYYFLVVTDHLMSNDDLNYDNNYLSITGEIPVYIEQTFYPDLQVEMFESPTIAIAGQPVTFRWHVKNVGEGPVMAPSWIDRIYLSNDFLVCPDDTRLATKAIQQELDVGESYIDSVTVNIPLNVFGNFIVIFQTDANNAIFETGHGVENNLAFEAVFVDQAMPSDLIVEDITFESPVQSGELATINYTLRNIGSNPATGWLTDMIYLSADSIWEFDDPLFKRHIHNISIAPQMTKTVSVPSRVPGLLPGNYTVFVNTNVLNNISEVDFENNTGISENDLQVNMPQLILAQQESVTLLNNVSLYYQIEISSEFDGETMMVALSSENTLGANQLYLSYEAIPTRSRHDYSATESFMSNQELIVPELQEGTYYLLVTGNATQEIDLLASIIPFGIRSVQANTGGNTGNVTLLIQGAKFENNMQLKLAGDEGNEYLASNVLLINSTKLFATFNLKNAFSGSYDVIAEKPVDQIAILPAGFQIVSGTPGNPGIDGSGFSCEIVSMNYYDDVATNVHHPARTRPNRVVAILIEYANNGNIDIPIPKRLLVSLEDVPISFDSQDFSENQRKLMLEFTEHGGPPGILRPGAQGTFTVYSRVDIRTNLRFLITK